MATTIEIKEGKCAECGGNMIAPNGLCLGCTAKAVAGKKMKSEAGQTVQKRFHTLRGD